MKLLLIVFFPLVVLFGCNERDELKEYVPIVYINDIGLTEAPDLISEEHINNLVHVLTYYKVKFHRISLKRILVDATIDRELQWNYTNKANDIQWLNTHPI